MNRLYSRTALIISILYAALAAGMVLYIWRMAEPESAGFGFLIYGIPWSVAGILTNCFGLKESHCLPLVLILNTATVYGFALAIVRIRNNSK
jgi:hypothetical protein